MKTDIQLLPFPPAPHLLNRTVIVIDVLRATSVMVQALFHGAIEIIPVTTVEEAFEKVREFPVGTTLLGGERGSRRIGGFDLGNSLGEYVVDVVKGKRLILTTTNGTRAFHSVSSGSEILVGCFLNVSALAKKCLQAGRDILLYPSGDHERFSLEDTVCAGMVIDRILKDSKERIESTDASRAARLLYEPFKANLVEPLEMSDHGRELIALGLKEDLQYCAQTNIIDVVPIFRTGVISIEHREEPAT